MCSEGQEQISESVYAAEEPGLPLADGDGDVLGKALLQQWCVSRALMCVGGNEAARAPVETDRDQAGWGLGLVPEDPEWIQWIQSTLDWISERTPTRNMNLGDTLQRCELNSRSGEISYGEIME